MPDPISNAGRSAYSSCDPSISSCAETPPAPPVAPPSPPVVSIDPVVITGDAGTQALLRQYDSQWCVAEKESALLSCPAIGIGVLNALEGGPVTGNTGAFHASVLCGKDLRALYDCNEQREALQASLAGAIAECHERDGVARAGASRNELVCEVLR